jgi:hypothetical protein
MHTYTADQIESEIVLAEDQICQLFGRRPIGFRAPGFSVSDKMLQVLAQRGYLYDASVFPNMLGPLAQFVFDWTTRLGHEERRKRRGVFGTFRNALRPIRPHFWRSDVDLIIDRLLEIPVTSMPFLKTPIHTTYLLYLSQYSPGMAVAYFNIALRMCRMIGVQPSILLHPPDFLGADDAQVLSFFPGMRIDSGEKMRLLDELLTMLRDQFTVVSMQEHARGLIQGRASTLAGIPMSHAATDSG